MNRKEKLGHNLNCLTIRNIRTNIDISQLDIIWGIMHTVETTNFELLHHIAPTPPPHPPPPLFSHSKERSHLNLK